MTFLWEICTPTRGVRGINIFLECEVLLGLLSLKGLRSFNGCFLCRKAMSNPFHHYDLSCGDSVVLRFKDMGKSKQMQTTYID